MHKSEEQKKREAEELRHLSAIVQPAEPDADALIRETAEWLTGTYDFPGSKGQAETIVRQIRDRLQPRTVSREEWAAVEEKLQWRGFGTNYDLGVARLTYRLLTGEKAPFQPEESEDG